MLELSERLSDNDLECEGSRRLRLAGCGQRLVVAVGRTRSSDKWEPSGTLGGVRIRPPLPSMCIVATSSRVLMSAEEMDGRSDLPNPLPVASGLPTLFWNVWSSWSLGVTGSKDDRLFLG